MLLIKIYVYYLAYYLAIYVKNVVLCNKIKSGNEDSKKKSTFLPNIEYLQEEFYIRPHMSPYLQTYGISSGENSIESNRSLLEKEDSSSDLESNMKSEPKFKTSVTKLSLIRTHPASRTCSIDTEEPYKEGFRVKMIGEWDHSGSFDLKEMIEKNRNSGGVLLVDFYANWCGPCRTMNQHLKTIRSHYKPEKLTIVSIDVDKNKDHLNEFEIVHLPTLLLFVRGKLHKKLVGLHDVKSLIQEIDSILDTISPESSL